jgi:16S rRNA processing protein RimM
VVNRAGAGVPRLRELPADAVPIGKVVGAHGIQGHLRVVPYAKDASNLLSAKACFVSHPQHGGERVGLQLTGLSAREQNAFVVLAATEIPDRSFAETLKGAEVLLARSAFSPAGPDEYYWMDLVGCTVVNAAGLPLGSVTALVSNGVHDVLQITIEPVEPGVEPTSKQRLIPFVGAYVHTVDIERKHIVVDWDPAWD